MGSTATYMLRRHQATLASAGKPEAIAERKLSGEAHQRALADMKAAYPVLTTENFEAADQYRKQRADHWKRALADRSPSPHPPEATMPDLRKGNL